MSKDKFTITAALPYANGPIHLGHVAGVYLPADIFTRFLRMNGHDVAYICGSDEHGAAITLRAKKEGITPQEIVDKYDGIIRKAFGDFGISFDIFHRTSEKLHHETAQDFFKTLDEKGHFTKESSEQYYDEEYDQFLADRYISGTCPNCKYTAAYGDQCENCGSALSPKELIDPKSSLSGKSPVMRTTSHWYLPMERHEEWLTDWIQEGTLDGKQQHDPSKWRKQVIGQCMSWINAGLRPRAMTRDLDWGVKVPVDGGDGKVLYVWLDAPIGYISATKQWAADKGKDWKDYWTGDRKLVHFIGKDNIVFHAIIFPILLKAHEGLILPDNVPAYEFLNLEGDKFSTSRNWAVWLHEFLADHPDRVDEMKYVLSAIAPETKDSEFTWKEYQSRVNNELADNLGNFVHRVLNLSKKYYEGIVPALGTLTDLDKSVIAQMGEFPDLISKLVYDYKLRDAQAEVMNLARLGNKYLADTAPWKLAKTDPIRVETIMNIALQITANLSIVLQPFLPSTAQKLSGFMNFNAGDDWSSGGLMTHLPAGHQLGEFHILFQKIEDSFVDAEVEKLEATKMVETVFDPQKDETTFDNFTEMDIRVGVILEAEKMKKADKLLKLLVDTGLDKRTIVSGIAKHYKPEDIIGKKVTVLMNLAPRTIRGVESQGMILMAENSENELSFVSPEKDFEAGCGIN